MPNDIYAKARAAQTDWADQPVKQRLCFVRNLRRLIAENADTLAFAAAAVRDRPLAEKVISEVLPLADSCRWLEKNAARVLASRRPGSKGRPLWMPRASLEVQRQPFGLILVIGPGNYPLFLPAVHSLQALVAGNAVLLKPAPGTGGVASIFVRLVREAGLDPALLGMLPEATKAAHDAIARGVDKVIFTGSSENGREVLAALASTNTPSVMELSGRDDVIVLADADLALVAKALQFGLRLNGGETCIAPRRLLVEKSVAEDLQARLCNSESASIRFQTFETERQILDLVHSGSYALGASIFSRNVDHARSLARRLKTGFVTINDLIVATADPRLPFSGVKASGFGTTRGDEGLLEMTFPHVVATRRGNSYRHFDEPTAGDALLFLSYIRAVHGHGWRRFDAFRNLIRGVIKKLKK